MSKPIAIAGQAVSAIFFSIAGLICSGAC